MNKLLFILLLALTVAPVYSQESSQAGTTKLIEFDSSNNKFEVPEGKSWHIMNIFCERNYSGNEAGIVLRSVNDVKFEKGPLVFYYNSGLVMNFPIVFEGGTQFELGVTNSGGKAIMTYIEY